MDKRRIQLPASVTGVSDYIDLANALEKMLVDEGWPDGHLLPSERTMAESFGMSRSQIRRALLLLVSRGRIMLRNRARAVVTRKNQAEVTRRAIDGHLQILLNTPRAHEDFQEARTLFEVGLVRHAACHATARHLSLLANALLQNRRAIGDIDAFGRSDTQFHRVIAEMLDNPFVMLVHDAIARRMEVQRARTLQPRGSMLAAYRSHVAVYEGIAAHDPDAAEKAIQHHLMVVGRGYLRATASDPT